MSRFEGTAVVDAACRVQAPVVVQDLPTAGFENRFSFTFPVPDGLAACLGAPPAGLVPVTMAADADGTMRGEVAGWARLRIVPSSPEVADELRASAPGSETRLQHVTVFPDRGALVLLIEEPAAP